MKKEVLSLIRCKHGSGDRPKDNAERVLLCVKRWRDIAKKWNEVHSAAKRNPSI